MFFGVGVLAGFVALLSPIDTGGDLYLFSLHMVQHLLLMMVAPPLVLLGIAGMHTPPNQFRRVRRIWWVLTRPWVALVLFNVVMLLWHLPGLYDTTLTTEPIHVVEHLSFLAVGIIFWWPDGAIGRTGPGRGRESRIIA